MYLKIKLTILLLRIVIKIDEILGEIPENANKNPSIIHNYR